MVSKREIEICIISDTHLGSKGCNALALCQYLSGIKTELLIMNGDIIDLWAFSKSKFNHQHTMVIQQILRMIESGTKVIYVTGNHDEALRRYSGQTLGGVSLVDHYNFELDNEKYWVFHGDVFDRTTQGYARILAKLGGLGYDLLITFNRWVNRIFTFFGKQKLSLSKKIKKSVKRASRWISDFENIATELAIYHKYDYVVCGHIHEPKIQKMKTKEGSVVYMNSGDWVESLSSLEYYDRKWHLYNHQQSTVMMDNSKFSLKEHSNLMFMELMKDFEPNRRKAAFKIMFGDSKL